MRIATWNCCRGRFEDMSQRLDRYAADVAIVQECWRPAAGRTDCVWMGDDPKHGLAIGVGPGWRITHVEPRADVPRYALPARIHSARDDESADVFVLGIWTLADRPDRYVKAAIRAVEAYRDDIKGREAIVAGDFNSNAIWNRKRDDSRDHKFLVRLLGEMGLVSAYHAFHGEKHGRETTPTFHMYKREHEPFHLDYCFVPARWAVRGVQVGGFGEWMRDSDHRPLVVDVHPPARTDAAAPRRIEAAAAG